MFSSASLNENCCICQETMVEPGFIPKIFGAPRITKLACDHKIHTCCVQTWADAELEKQNQDIGEVPCPLCRQVTIQEHVGKKLRNWMTGIAQIYATILPSIPGVIAGALIKKSFHDGRSLKHMMTIAGIGFAGNLAMTSVLTNKTYSGELLRQAKWTFNVYTGYSTNDGDLAIISKSTLPQGIKRIYDILCIKITPQIKEHCKSEDLIVQESLEYLQNNHPEVGVQIRDRLNLVLVKTFQSGAQDRSYLEEYFAMIFTMAQIFIAVEPQLGSIIDAKVREYGWSGLLVNEEEEKEELDLEELDPIDNNAAALQADLD